MYCNYGPCIEDTTEILKRLLRIGRREMRMSFLEKLSKELGVTVFGLIILIIIFIVSGTWVVFIPAVLLFGLYYIVNESADNVIVSAIASYYGTSVIMSFIGLLIYYFPNTIGGGLFESGYILADYMTLNSIIDLIWKVQTDTWGIVYNWIVVSSTLLLIAGWKISQSSK